MNRLYVEVAGTLALLLALAVTWNLYQGASNKAGEYEAANEVLADTVGKLDRARINEEKAALDAIKRRNLAQHERDQARQDLEDAKRHDPSLVAYFDSPVHPGAVRLLWANEDASYQGEPPGSVVGAYAQAGAPRVTHERGWKWAQDMESALDLCNGDKAAIKAWGESQTE
jgi:hypothetical protein